MCVEKHPDVLADFGLVSTRAAARAAVVVDLSPIYPMAAHAQGR